VKSAKDAKLKWVATGKEARPVGALPILPAKARPTDDGPLTAREIHLVRESFARIEQQAAIASMSFYRNLFLLNPTLRPLFHGSIELQGGKLMEALHYTVATLGSPAQLAPVLEAMGRRHAGYGTKNEHYATYEPSAAQHRRHSCPPSKSVPLPPDERARWCADDGGRNRFGDLQGSSRLPT